MEDYKIEYIDMMEERVKRELISDMECLVRKLNNAIADIEQGMSINSLGVVQCSGRNIDMNCYALAHIREIQSIIK